jgi:hypothetical protein
MKDLSIVPLKSRLLALPSSIRLGREGLPMTNTLAYYKNLNITSVKTFITSNFKAKVIKLVAVVNNLSLISKSVCPFQAFPN